MFAAGRDNVTSLDAKRAERKAGYEKLAVLETPDADLLEAREQVDREWEAWTLKKIPLTRGEVKQKVARQVDEARCALLAASQLCAEHDLEAVHAQVDPVARAVGTLLSELAQITGGAA